MKVEGIWLFEDQSADEIWSLLHDPAMMVKVVPDMHHLVKLGPAEYQFVLQPAASILNVRELVVTLLPDPDDAPPEYNFTYRLTAGGVVALTGQGKVILKQIAEGTQLAYELDGVQSGPLAEAGDFLLETQVRGAFRQTCAAIGRILRGEILTSPQAHPADTAQEFWLLLAGSIAVLLLLAWLLGREKKK